MTADSLAAILAKLESKAVRPKDVTEAVEVLAEYRGAYARACSMIANAERAANCDIERETGIVEASEGVGPALIEAMVESAATAERLRLVSELLRVSMLSRSLGLMVEYSILRALSWGVAEPTGIVATSLRAEFNAAPRVNMLREEAPKDSTAIAAAHVADTIRKIASRCKGYTESNKNLLF